MNSSGPVIYFNNFTLGNVPSSETDGTAKGEAKANTKEVQAANGVKTKARLNQSISIEETRERWPWNACLKVIVRHPSKNPKMFIRRDGKLLAYFRKLR